MNTPIPLVEELLQHRNLMLRLARSLVGRDEAEDVVQDAYTRALAHPPRGDENPRGWIARVTRNLALNRRRARVREGDRLRRTAAPDVESASLDARFETTLRVAEAVRALEEPYRSVILLRYFEDRSHEEIARTLGRPLATVRTQLRRGLEQLRARMDRECGGREAWSVGLLAWIDGQAVATGATAAATPATASPVTAWHMTSPLWIGVGLALALASWLVLRTGARTEVATPPVVLSESTKDSGERRAEPPAAARTPAEIGGGAAEQVQTAPANDRRYLVGRVLDLPAGASRAHVEVTLVWRSYDVDVVPLSVPLDERGGFRAGLDGLLASIAVTAPEPDEFEIAVEHPLCALELLRMPLAAGEADERGALRYAVEVHLRRAGLISGVVEDEAGRPVAGARVLAFAERERGPDVRELAATATDEHGTYVLRVAEPGPCHIAVLKDDLRPGTLVSEVVVGAEQRAERVVLAAGHSLSGRCSRLGSTLAGATVVARPAATGARHLSAVRGLRPGDDLVWLDGRFEWARRATQADANGAFRFDGLAPARYSLAIDGLRGVQGTLPGMPEPFVVVASADDVELALRASLLSLEFAAPASGSGRVRMRINGAEGTFPFEVGRRNTWFVPPHTSLDLLATLDGAAPLQTELTSAGPGEELERTLTFVAEVANASLDLEVELRPPLERAPLMIALDPLGLDQDGPHFTRSLELVDGHVRLDALAPGPHRLVVHVGADAWAPSFYPTTTREVALVAGETSVVRLELELGGRLRLDVRDSRGQRRALRFRLLDATGTAQSVEFDTFRDGTRTTSTWQVLPWATNELTEPLRPGSYELMLWDDDVAERRVPVRIEAGRVAAVSVDLD